MTKPSEQDLKWFELAVAEARASFESGGIPIGAAFARAGNLVSVGRNERVQRGDPIAHAEISSLRNAGRQVSYRGSTIYTTLSPCSMCSGAIILFGIRRVVVGEAQTFSGDLDFLTDRNVEVVLLNDQRCVSFMKDFQTSSPDVWNEDIGMADD